MPLLPPVPPELSTPGSKTSPSLVTWMDLLIRYLRDSLGEFTLGGLAAGVTAGQAGVIARLAVLEARTKEIFVFPVPGALAVGAKVTLPLTVRTPSTCTEVYANVETAPSGAAILLSVMRNGVALTAAPVAIADGATIGFTSSVPVPALAQGDRLSLNIDAVGTVVPGKDLVVQVSAK